MERCNAVLTRTLVSIGIGSLLLLLAACAGNDSSAAPAAPPVTQSSITLPSSVQVVTAH